MRAPTPPVSVAPMMDRTDRFFRYFFRGISRHTLLYTEMVHQNAVLQGDRAQLLGFDPCEHPIALQLGGDDATKLAECAKIAQDWGYDEVNLNIGCPSSRVQSGNFGVCLMKSPDVVARAVAAMRDVVSIPVTVKHRIGVDDLDAYEDMEHFVKVVAAEEPDRFTVHARKAWLKGLSPKENRNIPPLRYDDVYRLKQDYPELSIEINGGITVDEIGPHLAHVDAVMIGRAAWDRPYTFATVDRDFFGSTDPIPTREEVVSRFIPYVERWIAEGLRPTRLLRNALTLYAGEPGGRLWRRMLTENHRSGADAIRAALTRRSAA